jgi:hypothetical protein
LKLIFAIILGVLSLVTAASAEDRKVANIVDGKVDYAVDENFKQALDEGKCVRGLRYALALTPTYHAVESNYIEVAKVCQERFSSSKDAQKTFETLDANCEKSYGALTIGPKRISRAMCQMVSAATALLSNNVPDKN